MNTYSPQWAPHVTGVYEDRVVDPETGLPEEQKYAVACGVCGQEWRGVCNTGLPLQHVTTFAMQHLHRDPLAPR